MMLKPFVLFESGICKFVSAGRGYIGLLPQTSRTIAGLLEPDMFALFGVVFGLAQSSRTHHYKPAAPRVVVVFVAIVIVCGFQKDL